MQTRGMTLEEYKSSYYRKVGSENKFKAAYGIRDCYNYYCRTRPDESYCITAAKHLKVINSILDKMVDKLLKYGIVRLGGGLGAIELIKKPTGVYKRKDGTFFANYYINWDKTYELRYNDKEAEEKKLFYHELWTTPSFRVKYRRAEAAVKNSQFLQFKTAPKLRKKLTQYIRENKTDALLYEK